MVAEETQQEKDQREWGDSANWRWGLFYFGEKDSRVWVPKRGMFGRKRSGGTPNLAKPTARRFLMLVLGGCVTLFLLLALLRKAGILPG